MPFLLSCVISAYVWQNDNLTWNMKRMKDNFFCVCVFKNGKVNENYFHDFIIACLILACCRHCRLFFMCKEQIKMFEKYYNESTLKIETIISHSFSFFGWKMYLKEKAICVHLFSFCFLFLWCFYALLVHDKVLSRRR